MALCLIHRFGPSPQPFVILALALANAIPRGIGFADRVGSRYGAELHRPVVVAVIVAGFAIMLLIALRVTASWARPWFATLGALTYPLYLIHAHIGFVVFERLGPHVNATLLMLGTVAAMIAAATVLHRYVEKPLVPRLKRLLSPRLSRESAAAARG
ncbi:hypothetical protein [Kribbella sp. ALI-6-A]|uniref:hypothetical protein n=1 Tax=Kribbella sp. ALI-6-A TaxID=1933817 RepID=UPI00143DF6E0|nr:hypothetical protein [Kribbella sp. ALI-6-A]